MNISAPFIYRPIATALLMVALLVGGLVAYPLLPVAALPNVNYPTLTVTAQLPGADPQTMASTVASPLELQFGEIPGLTQMTSASALGYTQITLQFDLNRQIDGAVSDTLSAINAANAYLPAGLPYPPLIRKVNPADTPILVLGITSDSLPLTVVDAYAQNILLQKISQVSGVGLVGIGGTQQPTVRIQVDPEALAARGINLEDVRTVLGQANVDLPKGTLNSPRQTFTLNTNDQLFKPDQYADLVIAYRNGSPVRIRDIGRAVSAGENELIAGWYNNQPAIILAIQRQPGANVIETVNRIKAMMPVLQASIPAAVKINVISDRTQTIRASVTDVQFTLLLTIVLVVMVIFIFLRNLWATIIPAVTVPLSLVGTFAILYEMGYSLDNLSLMALSIAVGFVVDDAVVEIENITRHIEDGMSPYDAALKGSGEIGFTVMAITFSLIAVFIPLFLMGGYVGLLFREFAITVSVALVLSLIISRTLTPMMCAYLLKPESQHHGRLYRMSERGFDGLLYAYEAGLKVVLRHRFITLMVMFSTVALTGYLYVVIPKGFFPQQDTGLIIGQSEAAQDISFQAMKERQQALLDNIMKDPAVATVGSAVGAGGGSYTLNDGRVFIQLKPANKRESIDEVMARLRTNLAKIQGITLYMQAAQDITVGARLNKTQFQYTLNDADPGELSHWSALFLDKFKAVPGITDVATDQLSSGPLLDITIKREVASSYGILPYTIDNTLDDAFGQRIVSTMYTTLQQYHVILEVNPKFQYGPEALNGIYVKSSSGQQVPLSTLVELGRESRASRDQPHRTVPLGDDLVQSGAGHRDRTSRQRHQRGPKGATSAALRANKLPGQRPGVRRVPVEHADPHPRRALRHLYHSRRALRKRDPPDHHYLHPALGRRWCAAVADGGTLRSERDCDRRHHPIDRHRQEERHHAGGFCPAGRTERRPVDRGINLSGLHQALPPDSDDHDGGAARRGADDDRHRSRFGDPPAARLRNRRRPRAVTDSHTLHNARCLYLSRPAADLAIRGKAEAGSSRHSSA